MQEVIDRIAKSIHVGLANIRGVPSESEDRFIRQELTEQLKPYLEVAEKAKAWRELDKDSFALATITAFKSATDTVDALRAAVDKLPPQRK